MSAQDLRFEASATIRARPAVVWDILTDYREGHPNILSSDAFSDFRVEAGGKGDGTVIAYTFHTAGVRRAMRHIVSEPAPGLTLVEADAAGETRTTFTLTPQDEGRQTLVKITTDQRTSAGMRGAVERLMAPLIAPTMRRIYADELRRLDALAQRWPMGEGATGD